MERNPPITEVPVPGDNRPTSLDSFKTLVQVLALVVGGCWAFFRYLTHEREAAKVALEQQRLAAQQAAAVSGTEIAAESARLEQVRLANSQAILTLSFQAKTQMMAVEQQRLATEQSRLSLSIADSQQKLRDLELRQNLKLQEEEIALRKLQNEKATHEMQYQGKYRFEHVFKLECKKRRDIDATTAEFELTHGFQFVNHSEVPFEVSLFVIDYYVATASSVGDDVPVIMSLGSPANRWNPASTEKGALDWKLIGHHGSILAEAVGSIPKLLDHAADVTHLTRGGAGTGTLKPTESLYYDHTYFVRAPKSAYVTFVISYCLNRCATNDDVYSQSDWLDLNDVANKQAMAQH
jgi:hypothetical protein